jgi:formylglycine-generating enzyme required for sulfatase activity
MLRTLCLAAATLLAAQGAVAADSGRATVGPAEFISVIAPSPAQKDVHIAQFRLDRRPVTNGQFLDFVMHHPEWQRGSVPQIFADDQYLTHWVSATALGNDGMADAPVTRVSWYAARAYCEAEGARLPTWYEWELAAAADERSKDARKDAVWRERILNWYSHPSSTPLPRVGRNPPNFYGVQDLHGLIWEWVEDFNALMMSADSRNQGDPDKLAFCGAGALSVQDRDNYAILMRLAYLSALEARSTTRALGFRCAESSP